MFDKDQVLKLATDVIDMEMRSVEQLKGYVNDAFASAVEVIHRSKGRVVVTGIGKSAVIAQKIVATFNSTGTPALFMHAADAIHGDLGMIQPDDTVIIISKKWGKPGDKGIGAFYQELW